MADAGSRAGRLGVGVVGAGKVGAVLASALAGAGHALTGISAVSESSKERAEAMLPQVPILTVPQIVERSELVILAVPADQLGDLIAGLSATGAWQQGQLVVHTAAGFGTGVFAPALSHGVIPLAIHPAITFTGTSVDVSRLIGARFAVTAPSPVQPIGQALVVEMGGEPVIVAENLRPAYAEAIATASDFSAAILRQAADLLLAAGVTDPASVLAPLVRSSIESALAALPRDADAPFDPYGGLGSAH